MSKKSFSLRTIGIIEARWARGISVTSIAGELGTYPHRVQAVVDRLEHSKEAANNGRGQKPCRCGKGCVYPTTLSDD